MNVNKVEHGQPMSLKERVHFLDIVRGFALMGIILVNYFLIVDSVKGFEMESNDGFHHIVNWFALGEIHYVIFFSIRGWFYDIYGSSRSKGGQPEQVVCSQINHSLRDRSSACHVCMDWRYFNLLCCRGLFTAFLLQTHSQNHPVLAHHTLCDSIAHASFHHAAQYHQYRIIRQAGFCRF